MNSFPLVKIATKSPSPYLRAIDEAIPLLEQAIQVFKSKGLLSPQIEATIRDLKEQAASIKVKESVLNPPAAPSFSPGRRSGRGIRTR